MVDFSNQEEAAAWFEKQGRGVSNVFATRIALRAVAEFSFLANSESNSSPEKNQQIILNSLRCISVAWSARSADLDVAARSAVIGLSVALSTASTYISTSRSAVSAALCAMSAAVTSAATAHSSSAATAAINRDAALIEGGTAPESLAATMIWMNGDGISLVDGFPDEILPLWQDLKSYLLSQNQDWDVWTRWYEARVNGEPSHKDLDLAIATLPNEDWEQGPAHVNKLIKALEDKFAPPIPPPQGAGPHFAINLETGLIGFAPPEDIDAEGNNVARLRVFHPLLLRIASELSSEISQNEQPALKSASERYFDGINKPLEQINFDLVYGEGLFLENASEATARGIIDAIAPPLDDAVQTKLKTLVQLHGNFMMSSKAGLENLADSREFAATNAEIARNRADFIALAKALSSVSDLVQPEVTGALLRISEQPDSAKHPERSNAYRYATLQNVSIVLVSCSMLASPALLGAYLGGFTGSLSGAALSLPFGLAFQEGLKKSEPFLQVSGLFTKSINQLPNVDLEKLAAQLRSVSFVTYARFALRHSSLLRRFVDKPSRSLNAHLDWLERNYKE